MSHLMCFSVAFYNTVKPVLSGHSKRRTNIGFQDKLSLNVGSNVFQNAPILSTFIKLPFITKFKMFFYAPKGTLGGI